MAIYVYHGGNNTNGESWANAYQSIENAAVLGAGAGTEIWVASDHVEQKTSAHYVITFTSGTLAAPIVVISVKRSDDTYETMVTGGGKIETLGMADDITVGGCVTMYGITLIAKDLLYFNYFTGGQIAQLVDCYLDATDDIACGVFESITRFVGCTILPRDRILLGNDGVMTFRSCTFSTVNAAGHFTPTNTTRHVLIEDCNLSSEADIFDGTPGNGFTAELRRCTLAESYVLFDIAFASVTNTCLVESCVSGTSTDAILGMQRWLTYYGEVTAETTTYRDLGASDGTTHYSWKMTSLAGAKEYHAPLRSRPVTRWLAAGAQTLTVYVTHEAVGGGTAGDLQNDEFWIEVSSPNESSPASALGRFQTTLPATPRSAVADIANDTSDWTSAKSVKQALTITVTPTEAGPVSVYFCLGKPSVTVYVDPKIEVT